MLTAKSPEAGICLPATRRTTVPTFPVLLPKQAIQPRHRISLQRGHNVRVGIHCQADLTVTEQLLYYLRVHPDAQQQCRHAVAQIVKADIRQFSLL